MRTEESLEIVLNTSPIIVLTKLEALEKIFKLFSEIEILSGILEELKRKRNEVYQALTKHINEGKIL